jgi:hypothetical protein
VLIAILLQLLRELNVLRFQQGAEAVKKLSQQGTQFVRINRGVKQGSIAKVCDVQHINFRNHNFRLEIDGHRKFWMKGNFLDHLPGYTGNTHWLVATDTCESKLCDMMGKIVNVGNVIVFYRIMTPRSTSIPELVIGTVREIRPNGNIAVKLVKTSDVDDETEIASNVILRANCKCLILDKHVTEDVMLYKLTH